MKGERRGPAAHELKRRGGAFAARFAGAKRFDYSMGADYGMYVVSHAEVVTEIEAIGILSGADAVHMASGGIGGNEGAVILCCHGSDAAVRKAIAAVENVKGEAPQHGIRAACVDCKYVNCTFQGKTQPDLPAWTR